MKKLNLGCGHFKKEGYINVDNVELLKPDILLDLNKIEEYSKFNDAEYDEIYMSHILEHLEEPFNIMKELHRILKPGGILIIKSPHFSRGFSHAQHKSGFDYTFPFYFDKKFIGGYYGVDFELLELKLFWMTQFNIKREIVSNPIVFYSAKLSNVIISFLANLNPYFCSRIWCYWVGGFEEIKFVFRKPTTNN
jgi:SAM-dependent methyltransferase